MNLKEFLISVGAKYDEKTDSFLTDAKGNILYEPVRVDNDNNIYYYGYWNHFKKRYSIMMDYLKVAYDERLDKFLVYDSKLPSYNYIIVNTDGITTKRTYDVTGLVYESSTRGYTEKENCEQLGKFYILKKYIKNFMICSKCGSLINKSFDGYSNGKCSTCYKDENAEVCSYHSHHDKGLKKYYGADEKDFKGYGIELECEANLNTNSNTQKCRELVRDLLGDRVYFETDGSLRNYGFETITRPHTKEELLNIDWKTVLGYYVSNGCISHTTNRCGLHIHASRTLFGADKETQDDNIAKVIFFYEYFWSDIVKYSRRSKFDYCEKIIRNSDVTEERIKNVVKENYNRYYNINTTNKNTIEFRVSRGTLKYETFMATLDFTMKIVENSTKIKWEDVKDYKKWLEGISDNTREYLNRRRAFTDREYKTNPRNVGEI